MKVTLGADPKATKKQPKSNSTIGRPTFFSSAGVQVLGGVVLSIRGCQTPSHNWINILHPYVQDQSTVDVCNKNVWENF